MLYLFDVMLCFMTCFMIFLKWWRPRKGQHYAVLLDGDIIKGYTWKWRIWLIIETPHPSCRKRWIGAAWRVVRYKWSPEIGVLGMESQYNQQSRCRRGVWVLISPPPLPRRTLQGVTTLPILKSAVPDNGKVGNQVLCPHSRCFRSHLPCGSAAFQMKTCPSSSVSTLRGYRANLRNASVTFFSFVSYEASLGWH